MDVLETIENCENNKKLKDGSNKKKSGGKSGGALKSSSDKKKNRVSFRDERVPKKLVQKTQVGERVVRPLIFSSECFIAQSSGNTVPLGGTAKANQRFY